MADAGTGGKRVWVAGSFVFTLSVVAALTGCAPTTLAPISGTEIFRMEWGATTVEHEPFSGSTVVSATGSYAVSYSCDSISDGATVTYAVTVGEASAPVAESTVVCDGETHNDGSPIPMEARDSVSVSVVADSADNFDGFVALSAE
jgi:hypothetical protein